MNDRLLGRWSGTAVFIVCVCVVLYNTEIKEGVSCTL